MEKRENNDRLNSWKEIAQYLGRDIRTCWRWEKKYGLPVHRVDPESPKSRVYAFKDELDEWLRQANLNKIGAENGSFRRPFWKNVLYIGIPALGLVGALIAVSIRKNVGTDEPADFRIKGSTLIILNEKGRELWRHDTQFEKLCEEKTFRYRFQGKKPSKVELSTDLPWLIIKDIDQDGKPEVLFCTNTADEHGGDLICFGHQGKELWHFKPGREMLCGARLYSSEYNPRGFDTLDIDDDGNLETVVISHQSPNWPTQFALLDSNGRVLGEFWNSGHLADFILEDLNGDGRKELLAVGLNNEYGKGCLIVFDPHNIAGGSPQAKPEFTCRGLKPGTEKYYLIFPRTDVDLELNPVESMGEIYAEKPGILSLKAVLSGIYFVLDFDMNIKDVTLSHGFMQKHHEALLAGKVHSNIDDPRYKEALIKGVLYYDGQGWTTRPTQVLPRS